MSAAQAVPCWSTKCRPHEAMHRWSVKILVRGDLSNASDAPIQLKHSLPWSRVRPSLPQYVPPGSSETTWLAKYAQYLDVRQAQLVSAGGPGVSAHRTGQRYCGLLRERAENRSHVAGATSALTSTHCTVPWPSRATTKATLPEDRNASPSRARLRPCLRIRGARGCAQSVARATVPQPASKRLA